MKPDPTDTEESVHRKSNTIEFVATLAFVAYIIWILKEVLT
jgi:hypothetical protein